MPPTFAMQTPLSDEAVREAYFLGQHHDQSLADFFAKYNKNLPAPESGPHIASVTFLTPYALIVQNMMQRSTGYSAQQAEQDHRNQPEIVEIIIRIRLTASYGPFIPRLVQSDSSTTTGFRLRPYDFWQDFSVEVFNKDKRVKALSSTGEPIVSCGHSYSSCDLSGATLRYEFSAEAFSSDTAVVRVVPPEGGPVSAEFDLTSFR
jgi:hypothetical protein